MPPGGREPSWRELLRDGNNLGYQRHGVFSPFQASAVSVL